MSMHGRHYGPNEPDPHNATNLISESQEELKANKSEWSKKVSSFSQYYRDRARHFVGLSTETVDLYAPDALARISAEKTAWQRVLDIFRADDYDYASGEYIMIGQAGFLGLVGGGVVGAIKQTRGVREKFIHYHKATIFERPLDARTRLVDTLAFHGVRGGLKYGMKVGFMSLSFATIIAVITAVRNKSGIVEYTAGGFVMGALYRSNMGLTGALAGGCLGAALATIGGSCNYAMLRFSGKTYEEIAYWKKVREMNIIKSKILAARQQVEDPQLRMHDVFNKAKLLGETNDSPPPIELAASSYPRKVSTESPTQPTLIDLAHK